MADFAQILIRANDETKGAFDSVANNLRGLEGAAGKLNGALGAIGIAGGLTSAGLAAFAKQGIDAADALGDLSARTGVSVKTLAEWKLASEQSGSSVESLGKGIQKLSLSIGEAEQGSKEQAAALQRLGVNARDPQQAFEQLADAVASSNDPIRTNADLQKVLGKNYAELLPLLQGGSEALRDSAAASATFAEAMAKLAPEADRFNDQMALLKTNAAGLSASILAEVVPSLNEYLGALQKIVNEGTTLEKVAFFTTGFIPAHILDEQATSVEQIGDRISSYRARIDELKKSNSDTSKETAALNALIEKQVKLMNAPPKSASSAQPAQIASFPTAETRKGPSIDKQALAIDDVAAAWKAADDELKRYQGDVDFMKEVDLAQYGRINEIAQQWTEAGRALTDDMMTPLEKANVEFGRLDELLARGAISWETYSRAVLKTQETLDPIPPKVSKVNDAAKDFGLTFTSKLEDAIVEGGNFGDMLKGLEQDLARMAVRMAVTQPLMQAASGVDWGSVLGGLFAANADGGVYASPGLSAYSGSIVSSPTVFPFANGIGLMGEAGPEAILPLKRGADGKLGISGGGSGASVQVNVINNASGTRASASEREENGVRIVDVMVEQVEGAMSRRLGRGEGLAPVMERRYGLNATAGAY